MVIEVRIKIDLECRDGSVVWFLSDVHSNAVMGILISFYSYRQARFVLALLLPCQPRMPTDTLTSNPSTCEVMSDRLSAGMGEKRG